MGNWRWSIDYPLFMHRGSLLAVLASSLLLAATPAHALTTRASDPVPDRQVVAGAAGFEVGPPAVDRVHGPDRRGTALATARRAARGGPLDVVVVADPADPVGPTRALVAASGPWPVVWHRDDAAALAQEVGVGEVVDLAGLPADPVGLAVAWDQRVRGDAHGGPVALVTTRGDADLAAAAALGHTVLLTAPDALPAATRDALERLAPRDVVVVGGPRAIAPAVVAEVEALGATVTRLAGPDRTATSAALLARWPSDLRAAVVRGDVLVDAVAAAALDLPVVLGAGAGDSQRAVAAALAPPCRRTVLVLVGGPRVLPSPDRDRLPDCGPTSGDVAAIAAAELVGHWRDVAAEAGRPAEGPADRAGLEQAVGRLRGPAEVTATWAPDGVTAVVVELVVRRLRSDGSDAAHVTWTLGDLTLEPEWVETSSTVVVRRD